MVMFALISNNNNFSQGHWSQGATQLFLAYGGLRQATKKQTHLISEKQKIKGLPGPSTCRGAQRESFKNIPLLITHSFDDQRDQA